MKNRNEEEEMKVERGRRGEPMGPLSLMEPKTFPHNTQVGFNFLFVLLSFRLVSKELRVELRQSKDFWVACGFLEFRAI